MNILLTEKIHLNPYLNEIKKQCALDYVKSLTGEEIEFKIIPTSLIKKRSELKKKDRIIKEFATLVRKKSLQSILPKS